MKAGKKLARATSKARIKRNQTKEKKEGADMRSKMNGGSHPPQDDECDPRERN